VVPVVLYHVGVAPFSGGFCGVDIFFVISGFLIASLIVEELKRGEFTIVAFYERRIRRIFPALVAVLILTYFAASLFFMPGHFRQYGSSVVATVLFASNILFWRQSGYFDAPASEKPLLHTWSLAVEEQFYILFPILLYAIHRWFNAKWAPWLIGLAAASFGLSVVGVYLWPSSTFYFAPMRAWELMLGALLAIGAVPTVRSPALCEVISLVGLSLMAWSIFGLSESSRFPGYNALFPCVGAAMIILAGQGEATWTKRLLSTRPIVFVGLISYSLYLWHWPIVVFTKLYRDFTDLDKLLIVGVSFVAAILSWMYIERPFRRRGGVLDRRPLFIVASFLMALIGMGGAFAYASKGWPSRLDPRVVEIASYSNSRDPRESTCLAQEALQSEFACAYGADVPETFVLWGDSHAASLASSIGEVAKREGIGVRFVGQNGCFPGVGIGRVDRGDCFAYNESAIQFLTATSDIQVVIIVARYSAYLYRGSHLDPTDDVKSREPVITDASGSRLDLAEAEALFARAMSQTVDRLEATGKTVVLVYPIPETGYNTPRKLAQLAKFGADPWKVDMAASSFFERQRFILQTLDGLGDPRQTVRIYPHRVLCKSDRCAPMALKATRLVFRQYLNQVSRTSRGLHLSRKDFLRHDRLSVVSLIIVIFHADDGTFERNAGKESLAPAVTIYRALQPDSSLRRTS